MAKWLMPPGTAGGAFIELIVIARFLFLRSSLTRAFCENQRRGRRNRVPQWLEPVGEPTPSGRQGKASLAPVTDCGAPGRCFTKLIGHDVASDRAQLFACTVTIMVIFVLIRWERARHLRRKLRSATA